MPNMVQYLTGTFLYDNACLFGVEIYLLTMLLVLATTLYNINAKKPPSPYHAQAAHFLGSHIGKYKFKNEYMTNAGS